MNAQFAGNAIGAARVRQLCRKYGPEAGEGDHGVADRLLRAPHAGRDPRRPRRRLPRRGHHRHRAFNAVMKALAQAVPEKVIATGFDTTTGPYLSRRSEAGYKVYHEVIGGGYGRIGSCRRLLRRRAGRSAAADLRPTDFELRAPRCGDCQVVRDLLPHPQASRSATISSTSAASMARRNSGHPMPRTIRSSRRASQRLGFCAAPTMRTLGIRTRVPFRPATTCCPYTGGHSTPSRRAWAGRQCAPRASGRS